MDKNESGQITYFADIVAAADSSMIQSTLPKNISNWASTHQPAARLLIAGCYVIMNALGILLAAFLFDDAAKGASILVAASLMLAIAPALYYPRGEGSQYYRRRKCCHFILIIATLLFVTGNTANQMGQLPAGQVYAASKGKVTAAAERQSSVSQKRSSHCAAGIRSNQPAPKSLL